MDPDERILGDVERGIGVPHDAEGDRVDLSLIPFDELAEGFLITLDRPLDERLVYRFFILVRQRGSPSRTPWTRGPRRYSCPFHGGFHDHRGP